MQRNLHHIAIAALLLSAALSMGCEVRGRVESAAIEQPAPSTYALKADPTFVVEWTENSLSSSYFIETGDRAETDSIDDALALSERLRGMRDDSYGRVEWNTKVKIFVVYEVQQ